MIFSFFSNFSFSAIIAPSVGSVPQVWTYDLTGFRNAGGIPAALASCESFDSIEHDTLYYSPTTFNGFEAAAVENPFGFTSVVAGFTLLGEDFSTPSNPRLSTLIDGDFMRIDFSGPTYPTVVSLKVWTTDINGASVNSDLDMYIYDTSYNLISTAVKSGTITAMDVGIISESQPIGRIELRDFHNNFISWEAIDDVCFGELIVTEQPSMIPSVIPSTSPSMIPSMVPSTVPSYSPSLSLKPSTAPSDVPSLSHMPSTMPSKAPSNSPSTAPSDVPSSSHEPSIMPSKAPSNSQMPSNSPSLLPSSVPSATPSLSHQPSIMPSSIPSFSHMPSNVPSVFPSVSRQPSAVPSMHPSSSHQPSILPSDVPTLSSSPSLQPSSAPSTQPSSEPSIKPSRQPSSIPSNSPSTIPSISPSNSPSSAPSASPSVFPSILPSESPTNAPSPVPSTTPSMEPSLQPSMEPSLEPSTSPTSEYCQDYLQPPMLHQHHCGGKSNKYDKVPVCIGEMKKLGKSMKEYADIYDPDGDGYYTEYDTKCMEIDDIAKLANGAASKKSSDKHIESCGCCASGLEEEQSQYCHNVFFHGDNDDGQPSMTTPSSAPTAAVASASPTTTASGKGGKRKKLRHRTRKAKKRD